MFLKNYPHYPHKKQRLRVNKRTDVLCTYNKNDVLSKKNEKNIDIQEVKY